MLAYASCVDLCGLLSGLFASHVCNIWLSLDCTLPVATRSLLPYCFFNLSASVSYTVHVLVLAHEASCLIVSAVSTAADSTCSLLAGNMADVQKY